MVEKHDFMSMSGVVAVMRCVKIFMDVDRQAWYKQVKVKGCETLLFVGAKTYGNGGVFKVFEVFMGAERQA